MHPDDGLCDAANIVVMVTPFGSKRTHFSFHCIIIPRIICNYIMVCNICVQVGLKVVLPLISKAFILKLLKYRFYCAVLYLQYKIITNCICMCSITMEMININILNTSTLKCSALFAFSMKCCPIADAHDVGIDAGTFLQARTGCIHGPIVFFLKDKGTCCLILSVRVWVVLPTYRASHRHFNS